MKNEKNSITARLRKLSVGSEVVFKIQRTSTVRQTVYRIQDEFRDIGIQYSTTKNREKGTLTVKREK